ncbi:Auxin response factor 19-like protein [Drosera capensis]
MEPSRPCLGSPTSLFLFPATADHPCTALAFVTIASAWKQLTATASAWNILAGVSPSLFSSPPPLQFPRSMKVRLNGSVPSSAGEGETKPIHSELWHVYAGPLVSMPSIGSLAVYFPQGHSEQVAASM